MKIKKLCAALLCAALALAVCSCSGKEPEFDFENVNWGYSRSQVEKSQQSEYLFASDDLMMFEGEFEGEAAEVYYSFADDELVEVMYMLAVNERTISELIDVYVGMRERLIERYGEPLEPDYRVWLNEDSEYANDGDHLLIYHGLMMYKTVFRTDTSEISLTFDYTDTILNLTIDAVPYSAEGGQTE